MGMNMELVDKTVKSLLLDSKVMRLCIYKSVSAVVPTLSEGSRQLTVVFCINSYDRHQLKKHFGLGFNESHVPFVPASTLKIQAVDIDPFCGRGRNIILHQFGDFVAKNHIVQSPAFVGPSYFLFNSTKKDTGNN